ncbi:hypothetical protein MACK_003054 [Theileria orientalis]|uniref:Uncharacterized protein n=1 Tax=Theileria orientalis TaxID=68886 RepID=A0A976ME25_THEOR|nr:hypothetical protein MACK_003054 [Theileria orientalis]
MNETDSIQPDSTHDNTQNQDSVETPESSSELNNNTETVKDARSDNGKSNHQRDESIPRELLRLCIDMDWWKEKEPSGERSNGIDVNHKKGSDYYQHKDKQKQSESNEGATESQSPDSSQCLSLLSDKSSPKVHNSDKPQGESKKDAPKKEKGNQESSKNAAAKSLLRRKKKLKSKEKLMLKKKRKNKVLNKHKSKVIGEYKNKKNYSEELEDDEDERKSKKENKETSREGYIEGSNEGDDISRKRFKVKKFKRKDLKGLSGISRRAKHLKISKKFDKALIISRLIEKHRILLSLLEKSKGLERDSEALDSGDRSTLIMRSSQRGVEKCEFHIDLEATKALKNYPFDPEGTLKPRSTISFYKIESDDNLSLTDLAYNRKKIDKCTMELYKGIFLVNNVTDYGSVSIIPVNESNKYVLSKHIVTDKQQSPRSEVKECKQTCNTDGLKNPSCFMYEDLGLYILEKEVHLCLIIKNLGDNTYLFETKRNRTQQAQRIEGKVVRRISCNATAVEQKINVEAKSEGVQQKKDPMKNYLCLLFYTKEGVVTPLIRAVTEEENVKVYDDGLLGENNELRALKQIVSSNLNLQMYKEAQKDREPVRELLYQFCHNSKDAGLSFEDCSCLTCQLSIQFLTGNSQFYLSQPVITPKVKHNSKYMTFRVVNVLVQSPWSKERPKLELEERTRPVAQMTGEDSTTEDMALETLTKNVFLEDLTLDAVHRITRRMNKELHALESTPESKEIKKTGKVKKEHMKRDISNITAALSDVEEKEAGSEEEEENVKRRKVSGPRGEASKKQVAQAKAQPKNQTQAKKQQKKESLTPKQSKQAPVKQQKETSVQKQHKEVASQKQQKETQSKKQVQQTLQKQQHKQSTSSKNESLSQKSQTKDTKQQKNQQSQLQKQVKKQPQQTQEGEKTQKKQKPTQKETPQPMRFSERHQKMEEQKKKLAQELKRQESQVLTEYFLSRPRRYSLQHEEKTYQRSQTEYAQSRLRRHTPPGKDGDHSPKSVEKPKQEQASPKELGQPKEAKEFKDSKECKETRDLKEHKDSKEFKEHKESTPVGTQQAVKVDRFYFPQPKQIQLIDTNHGFQYVGYLVKYSPMDRDPMNKKSREWSYGVIKYWDPKYKSFFIHVLSDDAWHATSDQQLYRRLKTDEMVQFGNKVLWVATQSYYLLPLGEEPVYDRAKPMVTTESPSDSGSRDTGSTPHCKICKKKILYTRTDFTQLPKKCDLRECDEELRMAEFISEALATYDYPNYLFRNPVHSTVLSLRELEQIGFSRIVNLLESNLDITKMFFKDYNRSSINLYNKSTLYFCVKLIHWLRRHCGVSGELNESTRVNLVYWGFKCAHCGDHYHAKCLQYQHLRKPAPVMDKQRINARLSDHKAMCKNFRIVTNIRASYYSNENLYRSTDFKLDMGSEDEFDSSISDESDDNRNYKRYKSYRFRKRRYRKRYVIRPSSSEDEDGEEKSEEQEVVEEMTSNDEYESEDVDDGVSNDKDYEEKTVDAEKDHVESESGQDSNESDDSDNAYEDNKSNMDTDDHDDGTDEVSEEEILVENEDSDSTENDDEEETDVDRSVVSEIIVDDVDNGDGVDGSHEVDNSEHTGIDESEENGLDESQHIGIDDSEENGLDKSEHIEIDESNKGDGNMGVECSVEETNEKNIVDPEEVLSKEVDLEIVIDLEESATEVGVKLNPEVKVLEIDGSDPEVKREENFDSELNKTQNDFDSELKKTQDDFGTEFTKIEDDEDTEFTKIEEDAVSELKKTEEHEPEEAGFVEGKEEKEEPSKHKVEKRKRSKNIEKGKENKRVKKLKRVKKMESIKNMNDEPNYVFYPMLDFSTESNEWSCPECRTCIYCCMPITERAYISKFNYGRGSNETSMKSYKQFPPCFEEKVDHLQRNCLQTDKVKDVVCVSCNISAHRGCCNPVVPNLLFIESWKCDSCTQCISCGYRDTTCIEYLNWGLFFFFCLKCWELLERSNYCGICYKVWTNFDTNTQKWVQCEGCKLWIHVECDDLARIITDCPSSKSQNYRCCVCRSSNKMTRCMKVLEQIFIVDRLNQFRYPVSPTFVTYWRLVTKPMNLVTLFTKLEGCKYSTISEFIFDIFLIPYNAKMVNMPNTKIYKFAIMFERKCKQIVSSIMQITNSEIDAIVDSGLNGGDIVGKTKMLHRADEEEVCMVDEKEGEAIEAASLNSATSQAEFGRLKRYSKMEETKSLKTSTQLMSIKKKLTTFNMTFEFMLGKIFNSNEDMCKDLVSSCFKEAYGEGGKKADAYTRLTQEDTLFNFKSMCSFYKSYVPCGLKYVVASVVSVVGPKFIFPPTFDKNEDFGEMVKTKNLILLNKNRLRNEYLEKLMNPDILTEKCDWYEFYIDNMNKLNSMARMLFTQGFVQFRDFCVVCGSNAFQSYMIHCEECAEPMHYYCAGFTLPPSVMDYGSFKCSGCTHCERCEASIQANHPYELSNINNFHFGDALGFIPTLITNIVLFSSQVIVDMTQNQPNSRPEGGHGEYEREREKPEGQNIKYATFLDGRFKVDQNGLITNMSETMDVEQLSKFPISSVKCIACGNSAHLSCIKIVKPSTNPFSPHAKYMNQNSEYQNQHLYRTSESTPTDASTQSNATVNQFDSTFMRFTGDMGPIKEHPHLFINAGQKVNENAIPKMECWEGWFPEPNAPERMFGYTGEGEALALKKMSQQKLAMPEEIPDSDEMTEHEFKHVLSMSKKLSVCDDLISIIQSHINSGVVNKTNRYNYPTTTYKLLFKSHTYNADDVDQLSNGSELSTYSNEDVLGEDEHNYRMKADCRRHRPKRFEEYEMGDEEEVDLENMNLDHYEDVRESKRHVSARKRREYARIKTRYTESLSSSSDRVEEYSDYHLDEMTDTPRRDKLTTFFDLNSIFGKLNTVEEEDPEQQEKSGNNNNNNKEQNYTYEVDPFLDWEFDGSGIFTCSSECQERYNSLRLKSFPHDRLYKDGLKKQFEVLEDTYSLTKLEMEITMEGTEAATGSEDKNEGDVYHESIEGYNYIPTDHTAMDRDSEMLSNVSITSSCIICGKVNSQPLELQLSQNIEYLRDGDKTVVPETATNWSMCNSCKSYRKYMKGIFENMSTEDETYMNEVPEGENGYQSDSVLATLDSGPYSGIMSVARKSVLITENTLNYLITIISTLAPQISNTNLKKLVYEFMKYHDTTRVFRATYNSMIDSPFSPVAFTSWRNAIMAFTYHRKKQGYFQEYENRSSSSDSTYSGSDKVKGMNSSTEENGSSRKLKYVKASHYTMIKKFASSTSGTARFYWIYRDLLAYKIFFKNLGIKNRLRRSSPYYHYNKRSLQLLSNRLQKLLFHIINADIYNDASSVKLKNRYPYFRRHLAHLIINGDIEHFRESERVPDPDWFLRYTKIDLGTTSPSCILGTISYEGETILNVLADFIGFVDTLTRALRYAPPNAYGEKKLFFPPKRGPGVDGFGSDNMKKLYRALSSKNVSLLDARVMNKGQKELEFESVYDALRLLRLKMASSFKRESVESYTSNVLGSSILVDVVSARAIAGDVAIRERIMEDNIMSEFSTEKENVIRPEQSTHMKMRARELNENDNDNYNESESKPEEEVSSSFNACCICRVKRNTVLRGSLLPWRNGYVHSECVLWSVSDVYLPRTFNFNYDNYYTLFEPVSEAYTEMIAQVNENNDQPPEKAKHNETESETSEYEVNKFNSSLNQPETNGQSVPEDVNQMNQQVEPVQQVEQEMDHQSSLDEQEIHMPDDSQELQQLEEPIINIQDVPDDLKELQQPQHSNEPIIIIQDEPIAIVHDVPDEQVIIIEDDPDEPIIISQYEPEEQQDPQEKLDLQHPYQHHEIQLDEPYQTHEIKQPYQTHEIQQPNDSELVCGYQQLEQQQEQHEEPKEQYGENEVYQKQARVSIPTLDLDDATREFQRQYRVNENYEQSYVMSNIGPYAVNTGKLNHRVLERFVRDVEDQIVVDEDDQQIGNNGTMKSYEDIRVIGRQGLGNNGEQFNKMDNSINGASSNVNGNRFNVTRLSMESEETSNYAPSEMNTVPAGQNGPPQQGSLYDIIGEEDSGHDRGRFNGEQMGPEHSNLNLLSMPVLPPVQVPDAAVERVYKASLTTMCSWCSTSGATVTCANDNCKVSFHLCCAFIASSRLVHSLYKRDNPDHEYQERVLPVKMYYTRRKIWCASCFDLIQHNMKSYHAKSLCNRNKSELMTFFSLEGMASSAIRIVCRQTLQSVRIIPRVVDYNKLDLYMSYNSKLYSKTKAIYNRAMANHPHKKDAKELLERVLKVDEKKEHENKINSEYDFQNKYFLYGADKEVSSIFSYKVPGLKFPQNITHNVYRLGALTLLNLGEALMHDKVGVLYPVGFTSVRRFWNFNYYNRQRKSKGKCKSHQSESVKPNATSEKTKSTSESGGVREVTQSRQHRERKPSCPSQMGEENVFNETHESNEFNKRRDFGNSERSFYLCSIRALEGNPYFTIDLISHPCTQMPNRRISQGNDLKEVYAAFKKAIGTRSLKMDAESFFGLNLHIVLQQMRADLNMTMMRRITQFSKIAAFKNSILGARQIKYDINLRLGEPKVNYPFKISKQLMLEHITTSIEYLDNEQSVLDMTDVRLNRSRSRKQIDSGNTSTQYRYLIGMPPEQRLDVRPSLIHGLGLFASVPIRAGDPVVEYVGELIRDVIGDQREVIYSEGQGGDGSCYMFRLDDQLIVDATRKGNMSRFINHSCDPNCLCRIITCENGLKHIVVFAKSNLEPGDEITYDYQFGVESETRKLMCLCGAPNCLGRMN